MTIGNKSLYRMALILLAACFCGCAKTQPPEPTTVETTLAVTETTVPETTEAMPEYLRVVLPGRGFAQTETVRIDNTHKRSDRGINTLYYTDYVVVRGTDGAQAISDTIRTDAENFMQMRTREEIQEIHYLYDVKIMYKELLQYYPAYNGNGLISFHTSHSHYWGGDDSYTETYGLIYDLTTGKQLALTDLIPMEEDELLETIKDFLRDDYAMEYQEGYREKYEQLQLSDFTFYIGRKGDVIYLILPRGYFRERVQQYITIPIQFERG